MRSRHTGKLSIEGFTLLELLVVIVLIATVSVVILQTQNPSQESTLELSASELQSALRYARTMALSTNQGYGVEIDLASQSAKVFRLEAISPPTLTKVYDVRHPVDLSLYTLQFGTAPLRAALDSRAISYNGFAGGQNFIEFLASSGRPAYNDAGSIHILNTASVTLTLNDLQRQVSVEPHSGRVTIQ